MSDEIGAVIVAAGLSSRMREYKPMMEIGGISVARRVAGAFAEACVAPIVVVTGHRARELEAHLAEYVKDGEGGAPLFVRNEGYASTPMFESAKIGLSYIMDKCTRTFFCPVDVPLFTADTVRALMKSDAQIVKPVHEGKDGHPILIDAKIIPALIGLGRACGGRAANAKGYSAHGAASGGGAHDAIGEGNANDASGDGAHDTIDTGNANDAIGAGGLKAALAKLDGMTELINVADEGILHDADTPDDMARLRGRLATNP